MLIGNIYSVTALVSFLSCAAILRCNNTIYDRDNAVRRYFSFLLINFIICNLIDALWGFINTGTINAGRGVFYAVSFLIHIDIIFAVACWCMFLTCYFGFREKRIFMWLQCIPLVLAAGIMVTQIMNDTVFYIDESGAYHSGPYRMWMFYIQFSYYLIAFIKGVFFVFTTKEDRSRFQNGLMIECATIPVVFGVMQYFYSDAPYCSLGLLFSVILVFNGMMVIEKNRTSREYELVSRENFSTLDALSDTFVAVLMIDLMEDTVTYVKSTPYAERLRVPGMPVRENLMQVFTSVATKEHMYALTEFMDISTLPERLDSRRSVSIQYCSKEIGWCLASFIVSERDAENKLKRVVLAIQSINDTKQKELEYENALSRAYRNENAILAELIKMQAVGVIASDSSSRIIVANDALLSMFGRDDIDPIGMNIFEFWSDSGIDTPEEARNKYDEIEVRGGSFSYQLDVQHDEEGSDMQHLMADAKRVDLLDGTSVMVTCFTDITEVKILEDKLRTLSETDALTRIANRRCGETQINLLIREGVQGMFCLFDVDGFKKINDTLGHQTGDDTLVAVANAIRASFRANDIFMRLGGDEFAIYMRGVVTPDLAKIRIARLFENIARIELPGIPRGSIAISLGAVVVKAKNGVIEDDYSSIYSRADKQMYKCKSKQGSNLSIEETEDEESEESSQLHQGKSE